MAREEQGLPGGSRYKPRKKRKPVYERPDDKKAVTYRIGTPLRDRINDVATSYNVEKTSLVKFLLISALDQLDSGELELPNFQREVGPRKLDI